jgi:hypothetical protein
LTPENENRKPKSRKRKRAVPAKWKINKTKLLIDARQAYTTSERRY